MKLTKKQKKELTKIIILAIIAIVGVISGVISKDDILATFGQNTVANTSNVEVNISSNTYEVLRVVDGDTIQIDYNGTKEKVRMIGIDTPESVHPDENKNSENGKIASDYTKELLTGKFVALEFDVQERDKYGRFLAYVYLDGEMINKKLLHDGYAQIATYPPNVKYVDDFTEIQKEAKEAKRGLWAE